MSKYRLFSCRRWGVAFEADNAAWAFGFSISKWELDICFGPLAVCIMRKRHYD